MISVVIPTYNDNLRLELALWGLARQSYKEFELVIVNDGGDTSVEETIGRYNEYLTIRYHYLNPQSTVYRPSKARNAGIAQAIGDRIIFLDGDVIPSVDLIKAHAQYGSYDIAVLGPRARIRESALTRLKDRMAAEVLTFADIEKSVYVVDERLRIEKYAKDFKALSVFSFDTASYHSDVKFSCLCHSMNISYSKRSLMALDGFDERYDGMLHGEDHDLAIRYLSIGYGVVTIPQHFVYHLDHPQRAMYDAEKVAAMLNHTRRLFLRT